MQEEDWYSMYNRKPRCSRGHDLLSELDEAI